MAKNFFDSPWSWILALFTGFPFPALRDAVKDKYGMNATDREYIAFVKRQVESGKMSEEEARKLLGDNWHGEGDADEAYDSVDSSVGEGMPIGSGSTTTIETLLNSIIAYYTRNELTGAEREMNAFSAGETQLSRNFTEYMARNKYQMETESMQAAGVNPALVYGGGNLVPTASNGAAASSSSVGAGSIADLMATMVRMPLEMKRLEAEIENTRANTELTRQKKLTEEQETRIRGINADYQDVLNSQTISNMKASYENTIADTDYKSANRDYVITQADAQKTLNKYLDERQREEINQIKGNTSKMSAEEAKIKAEKIYQDWYNGFVQSNGFLPSSNDTLMLATYVASLFGIAKGDVQSFFDNIIEELGGLVNGESPQYRGKGGNTSPNGGSGSSGASNSAGGR